MLTSSVLSTTLYVYLLCPLQGSLSSQPLSILTSYVLSKTFYPLSPPLSSPGLSLSSLTALYVHLLCLLQNSLSSLITLCSPPVSSTRLSILSNHSLCSPPLSSPGFSFLSTTHNAHLLYKARAPGFQSFVGRQVGRWTGGQKGR